MWCLFRRIVCQHTDARNGSDVSHFVHGRFDFAFATAFALALIELARAARCVFAATYLESLVQTNDVRMTKGCHDTRFAMQIRPDVLVLDLSSVDNLYRHLTRTSTIRYDTIRYGRD